VPSILAKENISTIIYLTFLKYEKELWEKVEKGLNIVDTEKLKELVESLQFNPDFNRNSSFSDWSSHFR
jgi:hypothetical protein